MPIDLSKFLRFSWFPSMSWGSSFSISQKNNLHSLTGKMAMNHANKVLSYFSKWLLSASKVNFNSLKLSSDRVYALAIQSVLVINQFLFVSCYKNNICRSNLCKQPFCNENNNTHQALQTSRAAVPNQWSTDKVEDHCAKGIK